MMLRPNHDWENQVNFGFFSTKYSSYYFFAIQEYLPYLGRGSDEGTPLSLLPMKIPSNEVKEKIRIFEVCG